jgi:hypothetical protein
MLDALDTPGGHILICVILIVLGCTLKAPEAHDLVVFALGVLSRSMLGRNRGRA